MICVFPWRRSVDDKSLHYSAHETPIDVDAFVLIDRSKKICKSLAGPWKWSASFSRSSSADYDVSALRYRSNCLYMSPFHLQSYRAKTSVLISHSSSSQSCSPPVVGQRLGVRVACRINKRSPSTFRSLYFSWRSAPFVSELCVRVIDLKLLLSLLIKCYAFDELNHHHSSRKCLKNFSVSLRRKNWREGKTLEISSPGKCLKTTRTWGDERWDGGRVEGRFDRCELASMVSYNIAGSIKAINSLPVRPCAWHRSLIRIELVHRQSDWLKSLIKSRSPTCDLSQTFH